MINRILIIDDDETFLEELQEILRLNGYTVEGINNPLMALEKVRKFHPNLILLDLKMPGKSGFQLADELKHSLEFMHLPVLAMSGFFTEVEHMSLMNVCGIHTCLKKPLNITDLLTEISSALKT